MRGGTVIMSQKKETFLNGTGSGGATFWWTNMSKCTYVQIYYLLTLPSFYRIFCCDLSNIASIYLIRFLEEAVWWMKKSDRGGNWRREMCFEFCFQLRENIFYMGRGGKQISLLTMMAMKLVFRLLNTKWGTVIWRKFTLKSAEFRCKNILWKRFVTI